MPMTELAAAMNVPARDPMTPSFAPPPVYQRRIRLRTSRSTVIDSVAATTAATHVRGPSCSEPPPPSSRNVEMATAPFA